MFKDPLPHLQLGLMIAIALSCGGNGEGHVSLFWNGERERERERANKRLFKKGMQKCLRSPGQFFLDQKIF